MRAATCRRRGTSARLIKLARVRRCVLKERRGAYFKALKRKKNKKKKEHRSRREVSSGERSARVGECITHHFMFIIGLSSSLSSLSLEQRARLEVPIIHIYYLLFVNYTSYNVSDFIIGARQIPRFDYIYRRDRKKKKKQRNHRVTSARHPVISLRIATYGLAFYPPAAFLTRLQSQLNVGAKVCRDAGLTDRHVCGLTSVETREARSKKKERKRRRGRVGGGEPQG